MLERFRIAAIRQLRVDFEIDPGIREARVAGKRKMIGREGQSSAAGRRPY
jgi:hypothetical protein